MNEDLWLAPWLAELQATGGPVLELGCDTGLDTAWLLDQGLAVVATDLSEEALRQCATAAPGAHLLRHDLRTPLPFAPASFAVVVASLSLHYFDWPTTERIVAGIHEVLRPGGLLLCRLNSVRDVHHGAEGFEEIAPRYYRVRARYAECKRFFDEDDLQTLFSQVKWHWLACAEHTIHRYREPKVAWEIVLRPRATA